MASASNPGYVPRTIPASEAHARGLRPGRMLQSAKWKAPRYLSRLCPVQGAQLRDVGIGPTGKRWTAYQWVRRLPRDVEEVK